jgi:spermidine/putrescine transport system substrate-binding protein
MVQSQRRESEKSRSSDHAGEGSRRRFLEHTAAAAAGVVTGLAGCLGGGGGGNDSEGGETATGTAVGGSTSSGGGSGELADKINIYTFGGANGEGIKKAYIDGFVEEFGVEVNHQTISSGWDLIPKIKNDSVEAHVVEQNPGSVLGGLPDVWTDIRLENIPTVTEGLTVDRLRGDAEETTFDPGDAWHYVPKEVWAQGLVYNHDQLDEPSSWSDIYTADLKGKLTNTGFVALALGVAASEAGVDFNEIESDQAVADKIWSRVETQNEYVYQWWESGSSAQQLLTRESALAGNFWYGRVGALRDSEGVPVSYTVPEEGTVGGVSCWTVGVSEDPGRYTAEKFIDYQARPEPSHEYSTMIPYFQPYEVPDPPEAYRENPDRKNIESLKLWDYQLVQENREQWTQEFQKILRG